MIQNNVNYWSTKKVESKQYTCTAFNVDEGDDNVANDINFLTIMKVVW